MPDVQDFDADFPIPASVAVKDPHADDIPHPLAYRFAFVGCGQAGGKIAETFWQKGYRRVIAVNTTHQDLGDLGIPEECKLELGGTGAGKDPKAGAAALKGHEDEVYDLMLRTFGPDVDYVLVCFGAGGGTGAGIFAPIVELARKYMAEYDRPAKVGVIAALPRASDGGKSAANAVGCLLAMKELKPSPCIMVDNERIEKLYPGVSARAFFDLANKSIVKLLDLFNQMAKKSSKIVTFDKADFGAVLDSGLLALGVHQLEKYGNDADFIDAIRTQIKSTVLAPIDVGTCTKAALIFVVGEQLLDEIPNSRFEQGVKRLNQMLTPGATVYQGVYSNSANSIIVLAAVGGAAMPAEKVRALGKLSGVDVTGLL